jgi:Zinc knuckle
MTIDDKIARAKDLIAKREEIDKELAALFGGKAPARKSIRCSACGEEGHTSKTCPAVKGRTPLPFVASEE